MNTLQNIPLRSTLFLLVLLASIGGCLQAQTTEDGIMMSKGSLFTGNVYSHDSWDQYWEGFLKRSNGNIGTVTTQTNVFYADYGITNRLNVIASVPYVWTHASQGVLHDMHGFQDATLAAKYSVLDRPFTRFGRLRLIGLAVAGLPMTSYTPDFAPLSIGTDSKRISARTTLNFQSNWGWFVNGSAAYTWRRPVTLDRGYYFTEGQFFATNKVDMPDVFDYLGQLGYRKHSLMAFFTFAQERTQGGGDIRRQDMPFVSNRVNFSRVGGTIMYPVPKFRSLTPLFTFGHIVDGRNVGQSNTYTIGLLYTVQVFGRETK